MAGSGHAAMGIEMAPGPDQAFARHLQVLDQIENRGGIAIGPAADRQHRTLDGAVILADRAMAPEIVAALVIEPELRGTA